MTAEDPVEYNLFGINQVLVRTEIGMTFAAALKAFLRQDPEHHHVGRNSRPGNGRHRIKAALTGHLVLSTLHTNSAPETITRLMDMGIEPFNVASALNLVLAQRLVRRVCSKCAEAYKMDPAEISGAKITGGVTLRDMHFTDMALSDAKGRATEAAKPFMDQITSIPRWKTFPSSGARDASSATARGSRGVRDSTKS